MKTDPTLPEDPGLFADIVDATHDAIVVIDERGIIRLVNRATELIFGYASDELVGSNVSLLMRSEEAEAHDGYLAAADSDLRRRIVGRGRQLLGRRRDGSLVPIDLVVSMLPRPGGTRFYIGTIRDLSDRKLAEESLRLGFESSGVGQAMMSPDGRLLRVNGALARSLGYEQGRLIGGDVRAILHPDDVDAAHEWLAAMREGGRLRDGMRLCRHADGRKVWFRVAGAVIRDGKGHHAHCIVQFADVTPLVEAEHRLTMALAAAETASAAKTAFLAHMNHELRTPLNAVIGFAELLIAGLHGVLPPRQRDYVEGIHQAGCRLLAIVDDILDLTRLDDPSMLETQDVDVSGVVRKGLERAAVAEGRADVVVTVTIDQGVTLSGDSAATVRIIANLASNAIKFSSPGGRVAIEASRYDGDAGHGVIIRVRDEGPGMPAGLAADVGRPFETGGGVLSRNHGGAGLGLAIVRRLVMLMGGMISVDTSAGSGTTVVVDLPDRQRVGQVA
jgi:two-component system CheB/CheR fusion protein